MTMHKVLPLDDGVSDDDDAGDVAGPCTYVTDS